MGEGGEARQMKKAWCLVWMSPFSIVSIKKKLYDDPSNITKPLL